MFHRETLILLVRTIVPLVPFVFIIVEADLLGQRRTAAAVAEAVTAFLETLSPEQAAKASYAFDDRERVNWHFIPQHPRRGVSFKEMTGEQRDAAGKILEAALSAKGLAKVNHIMHDLEAFLLAFEGVRTDGVVRDPEAYYFTVFGRPGDTTWGVRFEGHHVSINLTYLNGEIVASTPDFRGANPAEVPQGPHKGLRVLGREMDLGLQLVQSLDAAQRKLARFRPGLGALNEGAPGEIFTYNAVRVNPIYPGGLTVARMTPAQQQMVRDLLAEYASNMAADMAAERLRKVEEAGFEKIGFAWAGVEQAGSPHYYKLQGPTFLIEYDNTQSGSNHIHTVWRDFDGDFGADLLAEHYRASPHTR